ncbi:MAG: hypothetical protein LM564_00110 [Desulfurococcaceae archaeon]|nr:hypothetical protein [Desulfurococcaceae archaeon]
MPLRLRPLDQIKDKWSRRASAAGPDYQAGLAAPRTPWSQAAVVAKDAWRAGVTDAAGRDAYAKGVAAAGDAKWLKKATELGVRRYPEGVSAAVEDYKNGFAPYYDALTKIELPPRGARGDPKNIERVRVIVQTLRSIKTATGK